MGYSLWIESHVLAFPAVREPEEPYSAHVENGRTVAGRGNADAVRLGKREKLERAGAIGIGVEERGLSGGVVIDAGPGDRIVGGGGADRAHDAP
jgi:hypothetical protein